MSNNTWENPNCPLCNSNNFTVIFKGTISDYTEKIETAQFKCTNSFMKTYSRIVECKNCGMLYNNPRIKRNIAETLYKDVDDTKYITEHEGRIRTFKAMLKDMEFFAKNKGKLLDIGSYTGLYLDMARKTGWETFGVEPSRWAAQWAANNFDIQIENSTFEESQTKSEFYDVISMWDVLEHLYDPITIVKKVHESLKQDGLFCFSTHNVKGITAKITKSKYPFLMEMHVCHFTKDTIKKLLDENGFELLAIKPHIRILRLGYFLEKLKTYTKIGNSLLRLSENLKIDNTYMSPGSLGLMNIFAKKI